MRIAATLSHRSRIKGFICFVSLFACSIFPAVVRQERHGDLRWLRAVVASENGTVNACLKRSRRQAGDGARCVPGVFYAGVSNATGVLDTGEELRL